MSALQIPKQVIPFNNNTNVTTTKGIARALTNSTSPQSDSENRPMISSVMNGAPPKQGHVISHSPGNQFKQSTISFNNKKSPHSMLKVNEKVFPDIASSSSSDSSPYSSDDEVLLVTQQKKEEPLKPAKVVNQASAKPKPSPASKLQLNINSAEKPKKKSKLPISPAPNGKTNGFKSDEKSSKSKISESGEKPKKPKKLKLDGHEKPVEKSSSSKSEKPKKDKDKEKDSEKKPKKISNSKPQATADQQKPLQFVISSDEDEPLCNLGKAKSESEKSTDTKLTNGSSSESVPKPKKPKPKKKPEDKPEKSATENTGDSKPIVAMSVDSSSDDNEDIPLSVIKLKSPVSLKTKPFTPGKSSKAKAAQNLMNKHFSTTADKGKLKVEYQQPPIISKLVKLLEGGSWKDDPEKQKRVKHLVTHSAKVLSAFERERIPAAAKQLILDKRKDLDEKERWKNLTPEQRECELKAKRLEKQRQLQLLKAEAPPKPVLIKQDDLLHESVRPLPKPTQIKLPEGVSMKMYGDVLMVIEFMQIFRGILSPDDSYELDFSVSFLLEALTIGSDGFLFLSSIVEALLKSLLQDQVNELLVDLETNLSHVTVTCHSVSDMCRLYLNHVLNDQERLIGFTPEPALFLAAEKLKAIDFVDLSAEEKLAIITFFVNEVLKTEVYEQYLQDRQAYYTDCSRWKMRANQEYQKFLKEKQDKETDLNAKKAEIIAKASEQVYGEQSAETASTVVSASTEMDEDKFLTIAEEHAILTSSMSRRQQEMELAKLRKDREERFKKIKLEQEIEESKIYLEKDKSDAEFEKISALVGKLSRLTPIGYDRFHNKYWILDCVPGILVERCWASYNISYETPSPPKEEPDVIETQSQNSEVASSVENSTSVPNGQTAEAVKKEDESSEIQVIKSIVSAVSQNSSSTNMPLKHFTRQEIPPKLLPRVGPNNWVVYDTVDQLDSLMKRLYEWGNREFALRNDLRKHLPSVREKLVSKKIKEEAKVTAAATNQSTQSAEKPAEASTSENKESSSQNSEVKMETEDIKVLEEEEEEKLPVIPKKFKDHYLSYLQSDMKDVHLRLFNGGLSWGNPEAIENQFDSAKSMEDIKQCMVRLYECVIPKFLTGICKADSNQLYAAEKQWNLSSSPERTTLLGNETESQEGGDDIQSDFAKWCERQAMKRLPDGAKQWQQEVITAHTWSRLHVLLGIFDTCVRWEKSVAKSGCTVCRKKTNEDQTLLCDECNRAYHMYCLRPVLKEVPQGDWLCPGCRPKERRNSEKPAPKYSEMSDDEKKKKEESSESEEWCFCCSDGGDELVMCSTCPRVFHLNCHQPPMRRVPRGTWSCMVCQNPKLKKKRGFLQTQAKDDEKSYNSDESSESSRSNYSRVKKRAKMEDSDTEEEEEQSLRRSSRSNKANLYKATLVRGTKGKYAESDGSETEEESSRQSSRNGRSGGNESAESSENESDVRRTRRSGETKTRRRLGSTSNEASPERDSVDAKRSRSSKRKRDEDSDSDKEAASKKQKRSQEVNANQAKENYEVEEVAEEVDICEKIFLDIKSRTQFMFFENIAEVDAYSGVENRVDFSTIKTTMDEKGYIWKGFIRDLAFIVNNALQAFEESHKVHRAALKMDERMRNLLVNLPIMLNRYSKIREGVPESKIEVEEKEREEQLKKENADDQENDDDDEKEAEENGEEKEENDGEEKGIDEDDDIQEPSCNGREQQQQTKQEPDDNRSDDGVDDKDYSRDNSRIASRERTPERLPRKFNQSSDSKKHKFRPSYGDSSFDRSEIPNDDDESAKSSAVFRSLSKGRLFNDDSFHHGHGRASPGFADNDDDDSSRVDSLGGSGRFGGRFKHNPAAMFMEYRNRRLLPCHFKVVEVEAEVDACAKMLHRFKHLSGLSYFVNVSDVAAYAGIRRKADFMKMEQKMKKKGYVWQGFVADLALIVNNALVAFQPKEAVYKAGIRLDKKVIKTLEKFPHMISHYQYMRKQANEFLEDDDDEMCLAQLKKPQMTSAPVVSKDDDDTAENREEQPEADDDDDGPEEDEVVEKKRTPRNSSFVKEPKTSEKAAVDDAEEKPIIEEKDKKEQPVNLKSASKTSDIQSTKSSPTKEVTKEKSKPVKTPEKTEKQPRQQNPQVAIENKTPEKDVNTQKSPDVKVKHSTPKEKPAMRKPSPEPEVLAKSKPSIKALFSDTDRSSDENKEKLLDKVNKSPSLEKQPKNPKSEVTPKKESTPAVVKSSPINFFKEDETTECIALCRKIFKEIESKAAYACFRKSEMSEKFKTVEKTTNFDEIESKIQSNDYTWNDFLADIACIINNSLFLFKPESSVYKAAAKLDSKMVLYLRSVSSMKRSYEQLRKITPLLRTAIKDAPSKDDATEQSSDKLPPTTIASPGIESATLFNETVESTLKSVTESEKSGDEAKESKEFESLNTESKLLTARTLDKNEIQKLCINLFMELKADENLVCLKYLTKDSACQNFAKKTDFAKIEKKLSRPGYIWGKFVKDLAAVTYIAMNLYPKESGVYQAGLSLNWKMETSLKKFPVMLGKFTRSRDDPLDSGSTATKDSSALSDATISTNTATSTAINTNDFEDKEDDITDDATNLTVSSAKQSKLPERETKHPNAENSKSAGQLSASAAKKLKTDADAFQSSSTLEKNDTTKSPIESSKLKEERIRNGAALELEEEIVFDEEKAICRSILDSLRQTEQFACFEKISKEYLEEMTDFESIAADLQSSDYKASNFAQDLATLVNRAMKQFRNVEPEIFSAAMRLDVRLLSLLYQVPRLREEYRQVRSQKADTSSPQRKEKPIKQDSKSNRSPESSKRAKMASSPDARTKVKKDNRNDSGFFDQSISKGTDKQAETKGINDQVSDAAVTPERSTSKSPERTPNAGSLKALTTKVQKVEVNEEVDICNKILQDIKSKYTFQVFQNVSEVPNYLSVSKRVDLMGIEGRMGESGYIWAKFIRDMAIIVNNALVVFEESHTVHKAALKLDARMLHLMQRLPIMKSHYEKTRSKHKTSESPNQQDSSTVSQELTPERNDDDQSQDSQHNAEGASLKPMYVPEFKKVKKSPNKKLKLIQEERASPRTETLSGSLKDASSPNRNAQVMGDKSDIKFDKQISLKLARIDVVSPKRELKSPKDKSVSKLEARSGSENTEPTVKIERPSPERESVSTKVSAITSHTQTGDDHKRSVSPSHSKNYRNEESNQKSAKNKLESGSTNDNKISVFESSSPGAKKSSLHVATPPSSSTTNSNTASEELPHDSSGLAEASSSSSAPGSPSKTGKSGGATRLVVVKEEVDEVVDICEKIFLDIRTKTSFIVFENVECVPAYSQVSRKADFSSIERQMPIKGYIWEEFIADMATIVNNAHSVFDENHKAYKAATRMDQRLKHIMRNLPIMLAHYNTIREQGGRKITSQKQDD